MDIAEYKFNVGDEVITVDGERGKIIEICECEECQKRGFYEPVWQNEYDDDWDYISDVAAKKGFQRFYKIGGYRFNEFQRDQLEQRIAIKVDYLAQLRKQLQVMNEIEGNKGD